MSLATRHPAMIGQYIPSSQSLGRGASGEVLLGTHYLTKQQVAIKCILLSSLTEQTRSNLTREITVMQTLDHANIVKLLDVITTDTHQYLVLEYCNGKDLAHCLKEKPIPETLTRSLVFQLVSGLQHGRKFNLLHRDLKPQNLLLHVDDQGRTILKIADFGFAKVGPKETDVANTMCGSPLYMAPEILLSKAYDAKVDLWSLGAIIYEMLARSPPFRASNIMELLRNIQEKPLAFPSTFPPDAVDLLKKLLVVDPANRCTYEDLFCSSLLWPSPTSTFCGTTSFSRRAPFCCKHT
jgi:serine/threonine-protein kinase ULK/ATG1